MDTIKTQSALEADKAVLDSKLAALQTKDGADAFLQAEKQTLQETLVRLKPQPALGRNLISMRDYITGLQGLLERIPDTIIEAEIAQTEKTLVTVEQELKQLKEADLSPDPGNEERR